jgi:hypothetical protein
MMAEAVPVGLNLLRYSSGALGTRLRKVSVYTPLYLRHRRDQEAHKNRNLSELLAQ